MPQNIETPDRNGSQRAAIEDDSFWLMLNRGEIFKSGVACIRLYEKEYAERENTGRMGEPGRQEVRNV
jgi:hypothetical protein